MPTATIRQSTISIRDHGCKPEKPCPREGDEQEGDNGLFLYECFHESFLVNRDEFQDQIADAVEDAVQGRLIHLPADGSFTFGEWGDIQAFESASTPIW
jgi:hypothetical protein